MIAIIKYNAGNVRSVKNAIERLGYECIITDDKDVILSASKVIFPGVGEASTAMKYLKDSELDKTIKSIKNPVLGICLGLQLMCNSSEEGNTECLGIFNTDVKRFENNDIVPHMGWNTLMNIQGELFEEMSTEDAFYFVHSFYAKICPDTKAECDYILPFSAVLNKNNFYATQFHPEKSGSVGELLLKNFLKL